ncbi:MAG: class I SAM-dependent methyltransferase [Calditrichaeota bacterium]|nr:class I SAM-dependent methyltransferase [Candidatus Cloacimonadota bacterium]MCA9786702.1 class I SAM-dependent methyltransferase [Candidatus Cloacimonadota bacterium]MCB1046025.1 class I SAM-dependent methyltransferase [Calditrichota bacterium]MCB9473127.1 class I SAM-dependent methyltransferase [Candidatus Delongbacteria bacterium]
MKPSPAADVRKMYDEIADSYNQMMDAEIGLPVYADVLTRLHRRITGIGGPVLDTACGSGHMLSMYRDRCDARRQLLGVDLSTRMVAISNGKFESNARLFVADMRYLTSIETATCAAVLNFFALHHIDAAEAAQAFGEWYRVLTPGGQLVVAAWEGSGLVDYGSESGIVAFRYTRAELESWARNAGFDVTRCLVQPVEDFPMDAVHLEAGKPTS